MADLHDAEAELSKRMLSTKWSWADAFARTRSPCTSARLFVNLSCGTLCCRKTKPRTLWPAPGLRPEQGAPWQTRFYFLRAALVQAGRPLRFWGPELTAP